MEHVEKIYPGVVALRRKLHQTPEIAGKEFKTQAAILDYIKDLPLEVHPPYLETDVVAMLKGGKGDGPNVTLRADIDALGLPENTGAEFSSQIPGMMHACGHDIHTAMLAGAARVLSEMKDELKGTVRFVWQPGEECVAMGKQLVEAGAIDDPLPDRMTAIHVCPGLPVGTIALKYGAIMASSTHFKVTVKGKSGHGSAPFKSVSPIIAAAAMITDLQQIIPNRIDPQNAAVLSFGIFKSGASDNVIPDEAVFAGSIRALDMKTAHLVADSLVEICEGLAKAYKVEVSFDINFSYNVTHNDKEQTDIAAEVAKRSDIPVVWLEKASMGGEDFCYFLEKAPGVYIRLGAGEDQPPLHNSKLLPPEEMMKYGIKYLVEFALDALKDK